MTKATIRKMEARMKRRNRAFAKLSKAQQRVAIARDVLDQLAAKRIRAKVGVYVGVKTRVDIGENDWDKEVALFLPQAKCNTCALGGLFVCAIDRANDLKLRDTEDWLVGEKARLDDIGFDTYDYLERFFDADQLSSIESTFEQTQMGVRGEWHILDRTSAPKRMRLIMENIIRNKGIFAPHDPKMLKDAGVKPDEDEAAA